MACDFSPGERLAIRNCVTREWGPHLSSDEFRLVLYIYDNSIEWGRTHLEATYEQMATGEAAPDDVIWSWRLPPLGIPLRTFRRLVDSLRAKGVIFAEAVGRKFTRYNINLAWSPAEGTLSPRLAMSKLPTPKRFSEQKCQPGTFDEGDAECQSGTFESANLAPLYNRTLSQQTEETTSPSLRSEARSLLPTPKIRNRTRPTSPEQEERASPVAAAPSTALEAIAAVKARSADTLTTKAASAAQSDKAGAYALTFRNAFAEAYPDVPARALTDKDAAILRKVLKAHIPDLAARHEFLDWTVRHWDQVTARQLGWMVKSPPPELPTVMFMLNGKIFPHFLDAHANRKRHEAIDLLPAEQAEIARLMADKGLTYEQALLAAGERRALSQHAEDRRAAAKTQGELMRQGEASRKAIEAEYRRLMRERAQLQIATPAAPVIETDNHPELPPLEIIPLAPFDPSKWN